MALPSSPPMLPEQDLPSSPPQYSLASSSNGAFTRKRQLSDYGSMSSDPIFSDNTSDGDAAHYEEQPRRKRLVRGPWWSVGKKGENSLRHSMAKKGTKGKRNADSGVWMGSDESEASAGNILSSQPRLQELAVEDEMELEAVPENAESDDTMKVDMAIEPTVPDSEMQAALFVQASVDHGHESVDLSNRGLSDLSNATLRPLHQLIRNSFATFTHPPSEDEFSSLTPSIQLYLSGNQLTALPYELFTLTNITVLSLRNNELSYLPPAIGRLHKLKELNVSGNGLTYLPWELLDLMEFRGNPRKTIVRPNPLVKPEFINPTDKVSWAMVMKSWFDCGIGRSETLEERMDMLRRKDGMGLSLRGELELRLMYTSIKQGEFLRDRAEEEDTETQELRGADLMYLASSAVRYFAVDGQPLRRAPRGQVESESDRFAIALDPTADAPPTSNSSAPSLLELTLRSLQANYDLTDSLPDLALSPSLTALFRHAAANSAGHGNETCSTCRKPFIIARAEWMEYWHHGSGSGEKPMLTQESCLPFLRRACSWGCARPSEVGAFRCWERRG